MAHDVFISYASADKLTADAACAVLEQNGLRVWIAPRDVAPGDDWAASIVEAIETTGVMVLVFSSNANKSQQICREVERAVSKGVPVLPLRIENALPSKSLEYFISARHWLDAMSPPLEQHLERLASTIRRMLEPVDAGAPGEGATRRTVRPAAFEPRRRSWAPVAALTMVVAALAAAVPLYERFVRPAPQADVADAPVKAREGGAADGTKAAPARDGASLAEADVRRAVEQLQAADFKSAEQTATAAIRRDPSSAAAYAYRGVAHLFQDEGDDAESDANKALQFDPQQAVAYATRAAAWANRHDLGIAAKDVRQALELDPKSGLVQLAQGYVLLMGDNDAEALAPLDRAAATDWRGLALTYRALAMMHAEKFDEAIKNADQAIALTPRYYYAYLVRSIAHGRNGGIDKSLSDADDAIRLNPESAYAYSVRAFADLLSEKLPAAMADAQEALRYAKREKLSPSIASDMYAFCSLAFSYNAQWAKALECGEKSVENNPRNSAAYFARALAKARSAGGAADDAADLAGAERDLTTAVELAPRDAYNWYWLAVVRMSQDSPEKFHAAIEAAEKAVTAGGRQDIAPLAIKLSCLGMLERWDDVLKVVDAALAEAKREAGAEQLVHYWHGRALFGLERWGEAEAELAQAVSLAPDDMLNQYWLASAQLKQEKFKLALAPLTRAIELGIDDADAYAGKSRTLVQLGRHGEAVECAEEAIEKFGEEDAAMTSVFYWLGRAQAGQGKRKEAIDALQKALKLDEVEDFPDTKTLIKQYQSELEAAPPTG